VKHLQMTGKFVDEILDVTSEKSVPMSRQASHFSAVDRG